MHYSEDLMNLNLETSFRYCELKSKSKVPAHANWQNEEKTLDEALALFEAHESNIGLLLGHKSNIIDIDCDSHEAVIISKHLVKGHLASFFRSSSSGHYLMRCEGGKTLQLHDDDGGTIIELRGNGAQTMIPPSIHPDGQELTFFDWNKDTDEYHFDDIHKMVHRIGALSLLLRKWQKGSRHQLSLCIAGLCQSIGLTYDDAFDVIQLLCSVTHDEEEQSRINNVKHTFQRPSHSNLGYEGLVQFGNKDFADKVSAWLQIGFGLIEDKPQLPSNENELTRLNTIANVEEVTEARLAELYASQLTNKALYCFSEKHWYLWDGNRWQKDEQRQLLLLTKNFVRLAAKVALDGRGRDVVNRILSFETANKMESLEKLAKPELAVRVTDFDTNIMQLCVKNGVIDLNTGKLLQPLPSMLHSKMAGVSFEQDARCPRFIQFLNDIFESDNDLIEYVQKVTGYMLTGNTDEQSLFMLLGGGANGKSTLVNILTKLLGEYAVNTPTNTLMASVNPGVGDDIVKMAGARLITAQESENGQRFAEAKIKSLTGGDEVTGRPLYGVLFSFKPVGKIVIATNNRPEIRGADEGIWRRIREIPFNRQFKEAEQDKQLMSYLVKELPGILNWAIEGCLKWQSEGLIAPEAVKASGAEYRSEMDTVAGFIDEECHIDASLRIGVSTLYEQYEAYCKSQGKRPRTKIQFGKSLQSQGYEKVLDSSGRYWTGLTTLSL